MPCLAPTDSMSHAEVGHRAHSLVLLAMRRSRVDVSAQCDSESASLRGASHGIDA